MNKQFNDPVLMLNKLKYYLASAVILFLFFSGFAVARRLSGNAPQGPVVHARIEEIRHVKHLRMVTYYLESMVEVCREEKSGNAYLLLMIPARVSCYVDLEQLQVEVEDTRITVTLPEPVIESPVLDFDSAKIFNLNRRYVTDSKSAYETVVRNVQSALARAREDVYRRAEINGIREEAFRLGKVYFEGVFGDIGYTVEVNRAPLSRTPPNRSQTGPDSLPMTPKGLLVPPEAFLMPPGELLLIPEAVRMTPEMLRTAPEVFQMPPEVLKTALKIDQMASEVMQMAPEVCKTAPEVCKMALEVYQMAPEVYQMASEVCKMAPEVYQMASEVCKMASEHDTMSAERCKIGSEHSKIASEHCQIASELTLCHAIIINELCRRQL
ncbi:MAG: DUF4230 domain-containing protein [Bacteroidales bacterium]|nr:DUF4230 domain-containing protein [Bacteroidales bacterium]